MSTFFDNIRKETIYIPLLNEGTDVSRPALGLQVGQETFLVVLTKTYNSEDEEWEFPPGSVVTCRKEIKPDGEFLFAVSRVDPEVG